MGEYCSFCDFVPEDSDDLIYFDDSLDSMRDIAFCPQCAEKYGYYACEGCGNSYPVWADLLTRNEDGYIFCKFCAERFKMKAKIIHRDKSEYLMIPQIPPKMYPFLIFDIIRYYRSGITKREITKELDCRLHNSNHEYYLKNGVDHKTVKANLEMLMDKNNPFHKYIYVEGNEYCYKDPYQSHRMSTTLERAEYKLNDKRQIPTSHSAIKTQLNEFYAVIPEMLIKCIAFKGKNNYYEKLFLISSYFERLSRLVYSDDDGNISKPDEENYRAEIFDEVIKYTDTLKYVLKRARDTESDAEKTQKLLYQISDIICPMMACVTKQATVKEYAYAIDYVIENSEHIDKPQMDELTPMNYSDYDCGGFAADFPNI